MLFAFFDLIHELGRRRTRRLHDRRGAAVRRLAPAVAHVRAVSRRGADRHAVRDLAQLVANSEYTVMRASGASLLQVGWALMRVGIPLSIVDVPGGRVRRAARRACWRSGSRAGARRHGARRRAAVPVRLLVQAGPDVRQHPQRAGRPDARRRPHLRVRPRFAAAQRAHRRIGHVHGQRPVAPRRTCADDRDRRRRGAA